MNIAFLVFASQSVGLGHIYRSLEIAEDLKKRLGKENKQRDIVFFINKEIPQNIKEKISKNFNVSEIYQEGFDQNRLKEELCKLQSLHSISLLFTDLNYKHYKKFLFLKSIGLKVISLNMLDYGEERFEDISILPMVDGKGSGKKVYEKKPYRRLSGHKYYTLRKEIASVPKNLIYKESISSVVGITMGGTDPSGLSLRILNILECNEKYLLNIDKIKVFVTTITKDLDKIINISKNSSLEIEIVVNATDFPSELLECCVVLLNGGMTRFEAIYLGIPYISISFFEEQREISEKVANIIGSAVNISSISGDFDNELLRKVIFYLDNKEKLKKNALKNRLKIVDGQGISRISGMIFDCALKNNGLMKCARS